MSTDTKEIIKIATGEFDPTISYSDIFQELQEKARTIIKSERELNDYFN